MNPLLINFYPRFSSKRGLDNGTGRNQTELDPNGTCPAIKTPRKVVKDDANHSAGLYPHSYVEKLWDDMYLEGRWSLPINSNPYIALQPAPPEHAAVALAARSDPQIEGATMWALRFCFHLSHTVLY